MKRKLLKMLIIWNFLIVVFICLNNRPELYNKEALNNIKYYNSDTIERQKLRQIKIAIIDEGITQQSSVKFNILRENKVCNKPSHGNVITNLLAAHSDAKVGYHGLIPDMPLYGYSLSTEEMDSISLAEAIETVISWDIDIISISLGTNKEDDELKNAIEDAVNHGIVIICSAGNNPYEANYPASFDIPGVISVGAISNDFNILSNTNVNSQIDIYAPGENIASFTINNSEVKNYSGTSVAVPFVALACIYIKAYQASLNPEEIENFLIQHTDMYLANWRNEQREIKLLNMELLINSLKSKE